MYIPETIDDEELLVRFIFEDHFKKKKFQRDNIKRGEVFNDTRLSGVSLQRCFYCEENLCKYYAKRVNNKRFIGFVVFRKKEFTEIKEVYIQERPTFEAEIRYTPLNENYEYLEEKKAVMTTDKGNPSHSDLYYINPAMTADEENPRTSFRHFSHKLFEKCSLFLDTNPFAIEYCGKQFLEHAG